MRKIHLTLLFVVAGISLSFTALPINRNCWSIKLSGKNIMECDSNKLGDRVQIKRSLLTNETNLSVHMYFCGGSGSAETMIILTNENGTTIAGDAETKRYFDFFASISGKEILSNPDFSNSKQIHVLLKINNHEWEELNKTYKVGTIELI